MDNSIDKYHYKIILLILVFLTFYHKSISQNIVNGAGSSSIPLNPGFKDTKKEDFENKPKIDTVSFNLGLITFTTKDKKLELNHYNYFHSESFTDFFIGIAASGEIKNSVTNIFSSGNVVSSGDVNLRLGFRLYKNEEDWYSLLSGKKTPEEIQYVLDNYTRPASDLWLVFTGGFKGSSFKHFKQDTVFSDQIEKINFTGSEINLGFNYWNARILNCTILAGATIGIKKSNNFDDLNESTQEESITTIDNVTGAVRKVITKQTVFIGEYKQKTFYPLNIDLYFVPQKLENLSFLVYNRTDFSKLEKPKTKIGFGLFFLKNQNAFNPVAGITIDYADIFNVEQNNDSNGTLSKLQIGITSRINIVNNRSRK
tara:strand:- start:3325 stop:4434 length:1110 start_codon:yes stop_codon:yes gene_type:complete